MRKGTGVLVVVLAVAAGTYFLLGGIYHQSPLVEVASAAPGNSGACTFPTAPAATPEQTAWEIFVAANCPTGNNKLVWETWVEQLQLYPQNGQAGAGLVQGVRRLHGSPLALARRGKVGGPAELTPNNECNSMGRKPPTPPMIATPTICEEVHLNPAAAQFITNAGYQTRPPQTQAAKQGTNIQFPPDAIEVKVDWIPATDLQTPFTCTNPPTGVHTEVIDGTCYAIAGMHIESKLLPNWLWATFEPQSMTTNPWRCEIFGPCNDPWGSNPAMSNGGASGFTQPTAALAALMQQAGLPPEFLNYRLDGVQTDFANPNGKPTLLGNSIIEGENVGMPNDSASCITCHSVSSTKNNGMDGIYLLAHTLGNPVGPEYKIPTDWIRRDFVWSMGLACPDIKGPPPEGLQTCTNSPSSQVKNKQVKNK